MKKILLLTTIYPASDLNLLNNTNVCHYFAKEWVNLGYEVKVIFNYPIYHPLLHRIARLTEKKLASAGSAYISTTRINEDSCYMLDGVKVCRFPLYKLLPKISVSSANMKKQIQKIIESNDMDGFKPDIITAHFFYPHLEMVSELAKKYNAKSCIVVHEQAMNLQRKYGNHLNELLDSINTWGYRSAPLKARFEKAYHPKGTSFNCYSGIPAKFLSDTPEKKDFPNKIKRFVYVGSFIKRKHPETILNALASIEGLDWHLDYVGQGSLMESIKKIATKKNVSSRVTFHGQKSREEVQNIISNADCFIMVSSNESFGLVYVEAMAKGLITIASQKEGMDGIIENGINGFLSPAGNEKNLAKLIQRINEMPNKDLARISANAVKTAKTLSDQTVAENYINSILA